MAFQHFLPATYLAFFSSQISTPRRNSVIWVGDKLSGKIFQSKVGSIAAINNFYTLLAQDKSNNDPNMIDKIWGAYEAGLAEAIKQLITNTIDGETWIRTLVPFVASLFVRGPDFNNRFKSRFSFHDDTSNDAKEIRQWPVSDDNINQARAIELQRLLAPISAAKWTVFKTSGSESLITSDLSFALYTDPQTQEQGVAIPLAHDHILAIVLKQRWVVAEFVDGKWFPNITYITLDDDNHKGFNEAISALSQKWLYGPDKYSIEKYVTILSSQQTFPPDVVSLGGLSPRDLRIHEFTWHRLATVLSKPLNTAYGDDIEVDYEVLSNAWHPPIYFPTNIPFAPSAAHILNNALYVDFYDTEPYYYEVDANNAFMASDYASVVSFCSKALDSAFEVEQKIRLYGNRGKAQFLLKNYTKALDDFKQVISLKVDDLFAWLNIGAIKLEMEDYDSVIEWGYKAADLIPDDAVVFAYRGEAYFNLNNYVKAISDFDKAIRLDKKQAINPEIFIRLAQAKEALEMYKEAVADYSVAIEKITDEKTKALSFWGRGFCTYRLNKNSDLALDDLNNSISWDETLLVAHFLKAQILFERSRFNEAIDAINITLKYAQTKQQLGEAYNQRGIYLSAIEDFQNGIKDFTEAIFCNDTKCNYFFNRGLNYTYEDNKELALKDFTSAIKKNQHYPHAYNARGAIYLQLKKFHKAILDFDKAIKLWGHDVERVRAFRNKILCLIELKRFPEAKKLFSIVLTLDPEHPLSIEISKKLK